MSTNRLDDLLDLNEVIRWNSRVRLLRRQTVAEHTFNVMVIASEIVAKLDGTVAPHVEDKHRMLYRVLRWALVHDGPESETGDVNYLFKKNLNHAAIDQLELDACPWYGGEVFECPDWARLIVKIADKIEEYMFIMKWCPDWTRWVPGILAQIEDHARKAYAAYGWKNLPWVIGGIMNRPDFGTFLIRILESKVESGSGDLNPGSPTDPVDKPITTG